MYLLDLETRGEIKADGAAWIERRKFVLKNIYTNLNKLISEAKDKNVCTSLAVFKPTKILDFYFEETEREWKKEKYEYLKSKSLQFNLFDNADENDIDDFEVVDKLPFKFKFWFVDDAGKESNLMIEDWETGMLFWNSLERHKGDEQKACEDVKKKYFNDFAKTKDYYFFLGSTKRYHFTAPNPFVIIGDFRPGFITQDNLFD